MEDEDYLLKWVLLESQIQHNQEKLEIKANSKKIEELEYNIRYYKQYLNDINYLNCAWNTNEDIIKSKLNKESYELYSLYENKKTILKQLRSSDNYGFSNKFQM